MTNYTNNFFRRPKDLRIDYYNDDRTKHMFSLDYKNVIGIKFFKMTDEEYFELPEDLRSLRVDPNKEYFKLVILDDDCDDWETHLKPNTLATIIEAR